MGTTLARSQGIASSVGSGLAPDLETRVCDISKEGDKGYKRVRAGCCMLSTVKALPGHGMIWLAV